MKSGGLGVAILIVIGAVLRLSGPIPNPSMPKPQLATPGSVQPPQQARNTGSFLYLLRETVRASFPSDEDAQSDDAELENHMNVPRPLREHVSFVIAIVPDPVHTHLAVLFDRSIEALQLAAQRKGYAFDRAVLPWDRASHPESSDFKIREQATENQFQQEAYPGLLIFRAGPDWQRSNYSLAETEHTRQNADTTAFKNVKSVQEDPTEIGETPDGPLFVFLVGETPTGGVRWDQFRNARNLIEQIRKNETGQKEIPLLILGPMFSGSLEPLGRELEHQPGSKNVWVYSGTITNAEAQAHFIHNWPLVHLASFQENDAYALHQFLAFTSGLNYKASDVAVLSEDETVYGNRPTATDVRPRADSAAGDDVASGRTATETPSHPQDIVGCEPTNKHPEQTRKNVLQLHFPREISYLRSAYQKLTQSQQPPAAKAQGRLTLPLDLDESGRDDDTVAPYSPLQTPLSQEAVMMGIVGELRKHHIKFTLLLATDPLDELFLARYLREAYPQGRVVITVPDLLLDRQDDASLHGVLGLNNYSLIPGLRDRLHTAGKPLATHEGRVFVSSNSVGLFNAMLGLLSALHADGKEDILPDAPYAEYGPPTVGSDNTATTIKPVLWLTMLGRDGYWPIVGMRKQGSIEEQGSTEIDRQEPILSVPETQEVHSTLMRARETPPLKKEVPPHLPAAWKIAYFLIVLLLAGHAILSAFGSILADSEARAQFARNTEDTRGAFIIALGASALSTSFILIMVTRNPLVCWQGFCGLTAFLWLPYPVFIVLTVIDIGKWRKQPVVAVLFVLFALLIASGHFLLVSSQRPEFRMYWSTRILHLTSGLSPVLPLLTLLAAGYWWMWISLKGTALVDLRRPRLPDRQDLPLESYRISDTEGEQLRNVSHPLYFNWQVMIPTIVLAVGFLVVLDLGHPVQTIEGKPYDWGYSLLLALMIAVFLGCLLKLVITWFKCRQVLVGLDRTPLRYAFSRMKRLSWSSLWTPGGSTLRETYKIMSRALENLGRLRRGLDEDWGEPIPPEARAAARAQVCRTMLARQAVYNLYAVCVQSTNQSAKTNIREQQRFSFGAFRIWLTEVPQNAVSFCIERKEKWARHQIQARDLQELTEKVGVLQKEMARMAAVLIRQVLRVWWLQDTGPVVSEDEQIKKEELPAMRTLAEEFAAIMYVNFLASVLLRIRTLVICAAGLYVLIVISVSVYPFEPRSALQTLMVLLLVVMGLVVGYVYAEMHREAILSRLTSTKIGELGLDFWFKFASAAAIPILSLLAGQFPEINRILFSWLEPALQAMK